MHPSKSTALCRLLALALATSALGLFACESTPAAVDLDRANAAYAAGDLTAALDHAQQAQRSGDGRVRSQAAYTGGVAAYRLGRLDEAERRLQVASASSDREVAGRARAMLGTINMDRNRPREAADHFRTAADLLSGDEAARAAYEAGLALRAAGDPVGARSQLIIASGEGSGSLRTDAQRELGRTGFTVQAGAFGARANAERLASELQRRGPHGRVWPVRIVLGTARDGSTIHIVQVGEFTTRQAAEQARRDLGHLEYRVVVMDR